MKLKKAVLLAFVLLLSSVLMFAVSIKPVEASGTIYIRADGSIEGTTHILTLDNVTYTFTDNVNDSIVIERDNIIVDGGGYIFQGSGRRGIELEYRSNVTIKNMEINGWPGDGIYLYHSSGNIISANEIVNNGFFGVYIDRESSNNIISGNKIVYNRRSGIRLDNDSPSNIITGNIVTNNTSGIEIWGSPNNTLRNNSMDNNQLNFGVWAGFINDVDTSNTINGKPIYYWINKHNMTIPLDAGYFALVNCSRITAQHLNHTNNGGALIAYTTNSTITQNNFASNREGLMLVHSSGNTITRNNLTNSNYEGISIHNSSGNTISGNNLANNSYGIRLLDASNNCITANNVENNVHHGIYVLNSSNNHISHNNFINNRWSAYSWNSDNTWDNGYPSGGNYWSDYRTLTMEDRYSGPNQNENGSDGFGDSPYVIPFIFDPNERDNYALMGMFSDFEATSELHVQTICNSTVSDFLFENFTDISVISFNVAGADGTTGFCRICIPTALMDKPYQVFVNATEVSYDLLPFSNDTYSYLYFTYSHSTQQVVIIPELPTWTAMLLMLTMLTVAIAIYKRRRLQTVTLKV